MTAREWADEIADQLNIELMVMAGYDDCIVGIVERFGSDPFIVYDRKKVLTKLMSDGMSHEEALEFHEFNQLGAWVGKHTPGFIDMP